MQITGGVTPEHATVPVSHTYRSGTDGGIGLNISAWLEARWLCASRSSLTGHICRCVLTFTAISGTSLRGRSMVAHQGVLLGYALVKADESHKTKITVSVAVHIHFYVLRQTQSLVFSSFNQNLLQEICLVMKYKAGVPTLWRVLRFKRRIDYHTIPYLCTKWYRV